MAELQMHSPSSGHFPSKKHATFPVQEPGYFYKNQEDLWEQDLQEAENNCHLFRWSQRYDRGADPQYRPETPSAWFYPKASPILPPDRRWRTGRADFWNWERQIQFPSDRTLQQGTPTSSKRMGKEERHCCIVKFYGKRAIFVIRIIVINQAKCRKHSQFKSGKNEFCVI